MKRKLFVLVLTLILPALSAGTFQAQLRGTTLDGGLLVSSGIQDGPGNIRVNLAGIEIPPSAREHFASYCRKVLRDRPLMVQVLETEEETPAMRSYVAIVKVVAPGGKTIHLNKQLLVDGYAVCDKSALGRDLGRFESAGQKRQVGLWSPGRSKWVSPKIGQTELKQHAQMTDRDRMIAKHGLPDFTRKERPKRIHSLSSNPLVIKDFYVRKGLVFIYRDGKLLNRQPYNQQG